MTKWIALIIVCVSLLAMCSPKKRDEALNDVIKAKDVPSICASEAGIPTARDHKVSPEEMSKLNACADKYMAIIRERNGK